MPTFDNFLLPTGLTKQSLHSLSFEEKKAILSQCPVFEDCPCCGVPRPDCDVDMSGSPCVAWSSAGKRRGAEDPTLGSANIFLGNM